MNLPEDRKNYTNRDIVRIVGNNITPAEVNYLGRFVEGVSLVPRGKRSVQSFSTTAVDQIRAVWEQKRQGINPAQALKNLGKQLQLDRGYYMAFNAKSSPWNFERGLQSDPDVDNYSLLYGEPDLLVVTKHSSYTAAHQWQTHMHELGLIPNQEIGILEATGTRTEDPHDPGLFRGHVLMSVGRYYRDLVSAKLNAFKEQRPEGTVSLSAQMLGEGDKWNFMVNIGAQSLEAFELVGRNRLFEQHQVQKTAVLMAESHYPNTNNSREAVNLPTEATASFIWLSTKIGVGDDYLQRCIKMFEDWGVGLNAGTQLLTGEHNLVLEVVPQQPGFQDTFYYKIKDWDLARGMRVDHVVPSSNNRGFFAPEVPRAYAVIKAARSVAVPVIKEDIEQLGDEAVVRAYRVLGRTEADIIAAISLDPKDPDRVRRINNSIRTTALVDQVSTFL